MDYEFNNLITIRGKVKYFRSINQTQVQLGFEEGLAVAELSVRERWVIGRGDVVTLCGVRNDNTGMFYAIAYKNQTKGIIGCNFTGPTPLYSGFGRKMSLFLIIGLVMLLSLNILGILIGFTVAIIAGYLIFRDVKFSKEYNRRQEWYRYAKEQVEEDLL